MDNGMLILIDKGGIWTKALLLGLPIWAVVVVAMMLEQRRRLARLTAEVVACDLGDDPAEHAARMLLRRLDFFTGGQAGMLVLGSWWFMAMVALIWTLTISMDILRLGDEAYLTELVSGTTISDVVRLFSSSLITRSMVGILGVPTLFFTLIMADQMLFRPRTRLLDKVRQLALEKDPDRPGTDAARRILVKRAEATWSWMALFFSWIWLLAKGLPRHALIVLGLQIAVGVIMSVITVMGLIPQWTGPEGAVGAEPSAVAMFLRMVLAAMLPLLPSLLIIMVVAARGHGWVARKE